MAFADISYFGDTGSFGGEPSWSGRVTSVSQLDGYDWGGGRKVPFSSAIGGKSNRDMEDLIDRAIRRRERSDRMRDALDRGSILRDINRLDNKVGGAVVGISDGGNVRPNDIDFGVRGSTVNSQFPFASRISYDQLNNELVLFLRVLGVSGIGRVVSVGNEQKVSVYRKPRSFYFSLKMDKDERRLKIVNCKVFLGCLGTSVKCDDVVIDEDCTGTYYAIVDFKEEASLPKLSVEKRENVEDGHEEDGRDPDSYRFEFPLYRFEKGVCTKENAGMYILPTYTFIAGE